MLNEDDLKDMIKSVGIRRKLMTKRNDLLSMEDLKRTSPDRCETIASTSYSVSVRNAPHIVRRS